MTIRLTPVERRVLAIVISVGELRGADGRDFATAEGTVLPGSIIRALIRKGLLSVHRLGTKTTPAIVRPSIGAAGRMAEHRQVDIGARRTAA